MKVVPITKIIATGAFSLWSLLLRTSPDLAILLGIELLLLAIMGLLVKQIRAVMALFIFAGFLALVQFLGGGTIESALVTGIRMLCMTVVFIYLLATTRLQDLTASLVTQCKVPYEYAFMFTAALRFVPDFIAESKAVQEAQACRGMGIEGNLFKRLQSYASIMQPLVLKSLDRSETMALSLELRGFGSKERSFSNKVSMNVPDYLLVGCMAMVTAVLLGYRLGMFGA